MAWLRGTPAQEFCISSITVQEIRSGTESMPYGRKRLEIEVWLDQDILRGFAKRILPVDAAVADACGRIVAATIRQGHQPSLDDALIAATAAVHKLQVATLNRKHFTRLGVPLIDFRL